MIEINDNGYVNITQLCKLGGKEFKSWNRLNKTKLFIKKLSSKLNTKEEELIMYQKNTWAHPRIATNIAQWISVDFDIFITECVEDWKTKIDNKDRYNKEIFNIEGNNNNKEEAIIRDRLCLELIGKSEVETEDGFIDILTDTEIIEIKLAKNWKSAIGQILVYGKYYPKHQKRIHLFNVDKDVNDLKSKIECFGIKLTYE